MNVKAITLHYSVCALWSTPAHDDDDVEYLDETESELSDDALAEMEKDCQTFFDINKADLQMFTEQGYDEAAVGHDFWLTRNGHGAGFWDRDLGELGERLTQAAHDFGSCELYLGSDGQIHVE